MKKINKLALAVLAASLSSYVSAVELGEFNGTTFSVGGYLKAEGIFSQPDVDGLDNTFDGSARQSRINFGAAKEVEGHKIKGFVEGDFWGGSNSYDWRLRHAYLTVDNLTVGQTWNGQFWATAPFDSELIDFFNQGFGTIAGNGAVVRRDLELHYQMGDFRLTLQDPIYTDADTPDLVVNYAKRFEGGHAVSIALTGRDVETDTVSNDSEYGVALSVAGKLSLGATTLTASVFSGEGQAVYAGYGYYGAKGASTSDVNADGDLITTTGFAVGVGHKFNDKLRGTIRYGEVSPDEVATGLDDTMSLTSVNLIYTYLPGLEFGVEWRDQSQTSRPSSAFDNSSRRNEGQQIELMAMYKF